MEESVISAETMMFKLAESINENTIHGLISQIPIFMHGIAYAEAQKTIDLAMQENKLDVIEITKYAILLGYMYRASEQKIYLEEAMKR